MLPTATLRDKVKAQLLYSAILWRSLVIHSNYYGKTRTRLLSLFKIVVSDVPVRKDVTHVTCSCYAIFDLLSHRCSINSSIGNRYSTAQYKNCFVPKSTIAKVDQSSDFGSQNVPHNPSKREVIGFLLLLIPWNRRFRKKNRPSARFKQ